MHLVFKITSVLSNLGLRKTILNNGSKILEYVTNYVHLTEQEISAILRDISHPTFEKGTFLLKEGKISKECKDKD